MTRVVVTNRERRPYRTFSIAFWSETLTSFALANAPPPATPPAGASAMPARAAPFLRNRLRPDCFESMSPPTGDRVSTDPERLNVSGEGGPQADEVRPSFDSAQGRVVFLRGETPIVRGRGATPIRADRLTNRAWLSSNHSKWKVES